MARDPEHRAGYVAARTTPRRTAPETEDEMGPGDENKPKYYPKLEIKVPPDIQRKLQPLGEDELYPVREESLFGGIIKEILTHNEETLFKVQRAIMSTGLTEQQAMEVITAIQNEGILFRERME